MKEPKPLLVFNFKLVTVGEYEYIINDKIEIREGFFYDSKYKTIVQLQSYHILSTVHADNGCFKCIATSNPSLPIQQFKVVDEVEEVIKQLALDYYNSCYPDYKPETVFRRGRTIDAFLSGYNQAKATSPYSEKDMIGFAEWAVKELKKSTSDLGEYVKSFRTMEELLNLYLKSIEKEYLIECEEVIGEMTTEMHVFKPKLPYEQFKTGRWQPVTDKDGCWTVYAASTSSLGNGR